MDLAGKLKALDKIYSLYDRFVASLDLACKINCSHCCTTGVTLTTIEGYRIIQALESTTARATAAEWREKIRQAAAQTDFKPKITTNLLANLCANGIEPPEEAISKWKPCPFLTEDQCPIYPDRPFGCRCLVSRQDCGKAGYADMDDFVLSVNTVFLQTIEHLDAAGCTGNLLDMLNVMTSRNNRQAYEAHRLKCASAGLIDNQPLKILMIPPEHRSRMQPILESLREIRI